MLGKLAGTLLVSVLDFHDLLGHLAGSDAGEGAVLAGSRRFAAVVEGELALVLEAEKVLLERRLDGCVEDLLSSSGEAGSGLRGLVLAGRGGAAEAASMLVGRAVLSSWKGIAQLQGAVVLDSDWSRLGCNHTVHDFLGHATLVDRLVPLNLASLGGVCSDFNRIQRFLMDLFMNCFQFSEIELVRKFNFGIVRRQSSKLALLVGAVGCSIILVGLLLAGATDK